MGMIRKESKEKTLIKCVKAPFRGLIGIRNLYIYTMIQCSGHVGPGRNVPTRQTNDSPRAYSINLERQRSTGLALNKDFRELVNASSTRRLTEIIHLEGDVLWRQKSDEKKLGFPELGHMQRSSTVSGMVRIDEEEPCKSSTDDVKVRANKLPTSRSHR